MLPAVLMLLDWAAGPVGVVYGMPQNASSSFAGRHWFESTGCQMVDSIQTGVTSQWTETTFLERK